MSWGERSCKNLAEYMEIPKVKYRGKPNKCKHLHLEYVDTDYDKAGCKSCGRTINLYPLKAGE